MQEVPYHLRLLPMQKLPSKRWRNILKNGTMEHLGQEVDVNIVKDPIYTKDFSLKEEGKPLEEAYYTQFGAPFQGGGYRAATLRSYQRRNANPSYQERRQSMEEPLSNFMSEIAKRQEENSNMIKEIEL
ncbi:hypothetical protein Tco_0811274 [Tanacetum coccineum]